LWNWLLGEPELPRIVEDPGLHGLGDGELIALSGRCHDHLHRMLAGIHPMNPVPAQ
jgi:hypothetical protein